MFFYIVFLIILLPFVSKNKDIGIKLSFILIFFLLGFQYEVTRDWPVYVSRWEQVNVYGVNSGSERDLEFMYALIMKICKPVGFYGYLIICAIFNTSVIYMYVRKYINRDWVWLFLIIFMLRVNLCVTYMDINRQLLSIVFVMLGLYIFFSTNRIKEKKYSYVLLGGAICIAINIHTGSVIAIPILLFPFIVERLNNTKYLYVFVVVYLLAFVVDISNVSKSVTALIMPEENLSGFDHYFEEIASRDFSLLEQSIYFIFLLLFIRYYRTFDKNERVLALCSMVYIALQGYAKYTMLRALFYYQIFEVIMIPVLFYKLYVNEKNLLLKKSFLVFVVLYCLFSFKRDMSYDWQENWYNYQTLFSAPEWK